MSTYENRYAMCLEAFQNYKVLDTERGIPIVPTYFLMKRLQEENQDLKLFFIIGTDLLFSLHQWDQPEKLVSEVNFLVFNRPSYELNQEINEKYLTKDNFRLADGAIDSNVSSTFIRNSIKELKQENLDSIQLREKINEIVKIPKISDIIIENNLYS